MSRNKPSREQRVLALLRSNKDRTRPMHAAIWPAGAGWVPLPELSAEAGAQHGARLKALRQRGHVIQNEMIFNDVAGEQWSWYRLTCDAGEDPRVEAPTPRPAAPAGLFDYQIQHRDLG